MPVVLGRSPQATFCVERLARLALARPRRLARRPASSFTDLSYNGTYVRFNDGEIVSLRRGNAARCTATAASASAVAAERPRLGVRALDVLRFGDTQPQLTHDLLPE